MSTAETVEGVRAKVEHDRGFCCLCGAATLVEHLDGGGGRTRFCGVCGERTRDKECDCPYLSYRIYCERCCGGGGVVANDDDFRRLVDNPYSLGCDACLDKLEDFPVGSRYEVAFHLTRNLGVWPEEALTIARVLIE